MEAPANKQSETTLEETLFRLFRKNRDVADGVSEQVSGLCRDAKKERAVRASARLLALQQAREGIPDNTPITLFAFSRLVRKSPKWLPISLNNLSLHGWLFRSAISSDW
jgi:hypothetical protein